ncbi:MAG: hypothetical protein IPG64_18680 [Haliea sp.]|nr:hypothetical protein [Haliea sp.]
MDAVCNRVLMLRDGRLALDQGWPFHDSKALSLRTSMTEQPAGVLPTAPAAGRRVGRHGHRRRVHALQPLPAPTSTGYRGKQYRAMRREGRRQVVQLQVITRDLESVFREVNGYGD